MELKRTFTSDSANNAGKINVDLWSSMTIAELTQQRIYLDEEMSRLQDVIGSRAMNPNSLDMLMSHMTKMSAYLDSLIEMGGNKKGVK